MPAPQVMMEEQDGPQPSQQKRPLRRVRVKRRRRRRWGDWITFLPDILLLAGLLLALLLLWNPLPRFVPPPAGAALTVPQVLSYDGGARYIGVALLLMIVIGGYYRAGWWTRRLVRRWQRICPACGSSDLRRIPRRLHHRLLGRMGIPVRHYICADCDWTGGRIDETRL